MNYPVLLPVSFDGDSLYAVRDAKGEVHLVIKKICKVLGLNFPSQFRNLTRAHWAGVVKMTTTGEDGRYYVYSCLPLRRLPMWLARLNPGKVAPELRPKLIHYQNEAAEALAEYFRRIPSPTLKAIKNVVALLETQESRLAGLYSDQTDLHAWVQGRIDRMERKIERDSARRARATAALEVLPVSTVVTPDRPLRALLNRWIAAWVGANTNATDDDYRAVWHRLFDEIDDRYKIRCRIRAGNQKVKPLDILESLDLVPAAYSIAQKLLPLSDRKVG